MRKTSLQALAEAQEGRQQTGSTRPWSNNSRSGATSSPCASPSSGNKRWSLPTPRLSNRGLESLTYAEHRAKIEQDARSASRQAERNGTAIVAPEENEQARWMEPFRNDEGTCTYYQDTYKQYPFETRQRGYGLLQELLEANRALLQLNWRHIEAQAERDRTSADFVVRHGRLLYAEKPALRTKGYTWSTEEYGHPGLQRMYLRLKSIQRFTEVWALLERSARVGVLDSVLQPQGHGGIQVLRIAAMGGGPGYELLATRLFFRERAPHVQLELICMDLCPAWRPHAELLGFRFVDYDIQQSDTNLLDAVGLEPGELHFCIVSCVMIYVTTDPVLDMLHKLVHQDGVQAILMSERGKRTEACKRMEQRGGKVFRLLGKWDERQTIMCSKDFYNAHLQDPDLNSSALEELTFPNVPFTD